MPAGYVLVPGVGIHVYRVPASDLPNYVEPLVPIAARTKTKPKNRTKATERSATRAANIGGGMSP